MQDIAVNRTIRISVDRSTWPLPPALPAYPSSFPTADTVFDFNIPGLLLLIGRLTTPSHAVGLSLSEYWAYIRYLHAISADGDLRLTRPFSELDSHQKTILSDDFGMAVPMYWLLDRLDLGPVCDGRYFVDWVAASIGASSVKTGKRGPNKSPDFVAQDITGTWHVVECKGTQGSQTYRQNQLSNPGPPASGAIVQKQTITFPPSNAGQRLACGLIIGTEGSQEPSSLKIIDPVEDLRLTIDQERMFYAREAVFRESISKSLRMAGFVETSSIVSAPFGQRPASRPTSGRQEDIRQEAVRQKKLRATRELNARSTRISFKVNEEEYRGREMIIDLPATVVVRDHEIRSAYVRQGVSASILEELVSTPLNDDPFMNLATSMDKVVGATKIQADGLQARLQMGQAFTSEIELRLS